MFELSTSSLRVLYSS